MLAMILTWLSVITSLMSAGAWLYASNVKVTREAALKKRRKRAEKTGEKPNLGGIELFGAELKETMEAQVRWNSAGAVLAAIAVASQAFAQLLREV
ncbi:hypothetical protein [Xanthomonas bundabergensis]|uniref:hypothetical protein n=1 Tax=Xanthomonas bundabergensis TaxID=3160842 RepID=UPI003516A818